MEFVTNNYVIIIIVGAFLVFALIGYLIDMLRNTNNTYNSVDNNLVNENISPIEISKIEEPKEEKEEIKEDPDELLNNYESETK